MHKIRFPLGLQTQLGELTSLPQTPWLIEGGLLLRGGREKRERRGRGVKRKGRGGGSEERTGREGREGSDPQIFWPRTSPVSGVVRNSQCREFRVEAPRASAEIDTSRGEMWGGGVPSPPGDGFAEGIMPPIRTLTKFSFKMTDFGEI